MIFTQNTKIGILILGDLLLFYISLFLTLTIRYQAVVSQSIWDEHRTAFLFVHILWLFIFYISSAYDIKTFVSYKKIVEKILKAMLAGTIIALTIFYLIPGIVIAPKTNLLIDVALLSVLLILWRRIFWILDRKSSKTKIIFFGKSQEIKDFSDYLKENSQFGYLPVGVFNDLPKNFKNFIKKNNVQLIIASRNSMQNPEVSKEFYSMLQSKIGIINFEKFYETLAEKIPVSMVKEEWFLENLKEIDKKIFEIFKRMMDIIGVVVLGIPTLIILPFVSATIKINSKGPVFYKQKRIGKNNKVFEIIKFRSMGQNAEKNGAVWATEKDSRITKIGNILRKTSIDELPQLWNVLKGEMSFIGPRPERPEFINQLEKEIPHYAMRHIIKPGLSGWAQIKYPYGASVEDAKEKLQYDLYYIKNRSIVLDLAIGVKTIFALIARKVH